MTICRLVYMSERNMSVSMDVEQIIKTSVKNNSRVGVTGFLMFDGNYFTQILEGSRASVTHTYNRIVGDNRHMNIHLINCTDVNDRLFPQWCMGLIDAIPTEVRDRFLTYFTLERSSPNNVPVDRLLFCMQSLAQEVIKMETSPAMRMAAE